MENNQTSEVAFFIKNDKSFYCSKKVTTVEEKKALFNALENCDLLLNNCVGEHIKIKDLYIEQYYKTEEGTEDKQCHFRTIIFGDDGKTYVSTSYGVYNTLNKLVKSFGTPDTWEQPLEVEVAKRPVGNGKSILTFKLV